MREPKGHLKYPANLQVIRAVTDQPAADYFYCTGMWGSCLIGLDRLRQFFSPLIRHVLAAAPVVHLVAVRESFVRRNILT